MKNGKLLGGVAKVAMFAGLVYVVMTWKDFNRLNDDVQDFAESSCIDEIRQRFEVSRVSTYSVEKNSSGYVVRATVTLNKGGNAKVTCLTNTHGGVRDVSINE